MDDEGEELEGTPQKLMEKMRDLEEAARKVGLYLDRAAVIVVETHQGPQPALVANFAINKVAFTQRIQKPEDDDFAQRFRAIEAEMSTQAAKDAKAQMKKNIEAGRHPLDDGDDEAEEEAE